MLKYLDKILDSSNKKNEKSTGDDQSKSTSFNQTEKLVKSVNILPIIAKCTTPKNVYSVKDH